MPKRTLTRAPSPFLAGDAVGAEVPPFIKGGAGGISTATAQANVAKSPPAPLWKRGEKDMRDGAAH